MPAYVADLQSESAQESRRAEHAAAFKAATWQITGHVARVIHKPSVGLLEEIGRGDKRGPYEVAEQAIEVSRRHKPELIATAPLRVLARRVGYDLTPVSAAAEPVSLVAGCAAVLRESGEAVTVTLAALADGRLTPAEARKALPEIDQAIADLHRLRAAVAASNVLSMPRGAA